MGVRTDYSTKVELEPKLSIIWRTYKTESELLSTTH